MGKIAKRYMSLWKDLKGWKLFLFYALHYTVLFAIVQYAVFFKITNAGLGFVWSTDGTDQHFARLLYISDNAHALWNSLISGQGFVWPLYDFRTGFTVHDLQVGLPHLLAAFWPSENMDTFYTILVIGNFYLAGLTFSAMCFYFKQKPFPVLIGTIAYIFSGYSIYTGVRHPHFMVPVVLLPVLIIGTERALKGERSILLTITVFLSLTAQWGLYFSCMQAMFVALYSVTRLICKGRDLKIKEKFIKLMNVVLWGVLGVLLSAAVMIPSFISMTGDGRSDLSLAANLDLWLYGENYFKNLFINFSVNHSTHTNWMFVSFAAIVLPALIMFFLDRRKEIRHLKVIWVILTVMHLIPVFAFVMSGFSNIANRFCFGYALFNVFITVIELSRIRELTRVKAVIVIAAVLAYSIAAYLLQAADSREIWPYVITFGTAASVAVIALITKKRAGTGNIIISFFCLIMTCVSVAYTATFIYHNIYLTQFYKNGMDTIKADYLYSAGISDTINNDKSYYRVDGNAVPYKGSASGFHFGVNTMTGYPYFGWSRGYEKWISEMELARFHNKHRFLGINARPQMLTLSSVKYFVDRRTDYSIVPYGFTDRETIDADSYRDVITENEHALPIGYTYGSYMLRDDYEKLWALDKQEAMMGSVIINKEPSSIKLNRTADIEKTATEVPCKIVGFAGITKEGDKYVMQNPNAMMIIEFKGLPNTNTYIRMKDMRFDYVKGNYMLLNVSTGKSTTVCTYTDYGYIYYTGQDTMLLDLGYTEEGYTRAAITFDNKGSFTLGGVEIWCDSMKNYADQADSLRECVLENVEYGNRSMKGTISSDRDRFLVLSIPELDGWTAYLDGKEVELYNANTAFMGIELPSGDHVVELRYWMPGLTAGLTVSGVGLVLFAGTILIWNRNNKKNRKKESNK